MKPRLLLVLFPVLVSLGAACASRGATTSTVPTLRRPRVELSLPRLEVSAGEEQFDFVLRVRNAGVAEARVDFTGDPLYPRGPRDRVDVPALWYMIEREDVVSQVGTSSTRFRMRDTVLAAAGVLEVPLQHSMRSIGLGPGRYRMRAGLGAHGSNWVTFVVTK